VTRAKRNTRKPPPGWKVYPQWYAEGPDRFGGDGDAYETRAEAISAAWDEFEEDVLYLARLKDLSGRDEGP
jgi:hypothetical protein